MFDIIYNFFESIGRARAASHLATLGQYQLARELMLKDEPVFEVHP